jgi:hypothetical protein
MMLKFQPTADSVISVQMLVAASDYPNPEAFITDFVTSANAARRVSILGNDGVTVEPKTDALGQNPGVVHLFVGGVSVAVLGWYYSSSDLIPVAQALAASVSGPRSS